MSYPGKTAASFSFIIERLGVVALDVGVALGLVDGWFPLVANALRKDSGVWYGLLRDCRIIALRHCLQVE